MKKLIVIVLLALSTNLTAQMSYLTVRDAMSAMYSQTYNFRFENSPDGDTIYISYTNSYGHNTGIWYAPNGMIEWDMYGAGTFTSIFNLTSWEIISNIHDREDDSYHGVIRSKDHTRMLGFYLVPTKFVVFYIE